MKVFLKTHYCGESPFGNGPDDGCDIRVEIKPTTGTTVTVDYFCKWDEKGKSECHEQGTVSPRARSILLGEMRRIGLPAKGENEVHFRVLESSKGWSFMEASYDHADGTDLTVCQVVLVVDPAGEVHVLRKTPLKKTNIDVPEVTSWSPVDIADVDGDGKVEVVLEADAYENHWFEVISLEDGSFKTVFSGLGYYL